MLFHRVHTFALLLVTYVSSTCCNRRLVCKKNMCFSSSLIIFHYYTINVVSRSLFATCLATRSSNRNVWTKSTPGASTSILYYLLGGFWDYLPSTFRTHILLCISTCNCFHWPFNHSALRKSIVGMQRTALQKPSQVHFNLTKKSALCRSKGRLPVSFLHAEWRGTTPSIPDLPG